MLLSTTLKLQEVLPQFYVQIAQQPWDKVAAWIQEGPIYTTGVGKSGYVARKVAATFSTYGIISHFIHPTEAMHGETMAADGYGLVFTASGATPEVVAWANHMDQIWGQMAVVIGCQKPSFPHRWFLQVPRLEEPVPIVQSILMQLVGDGLAAECARLQGFTADYLKDYHPA